MILAKWNRLSVKAITPKGNNSCKCVEISMPLFSTTNFSPYENTKQTRASKSQQTLFTLFNKWGGIILYKPQ